MKTAMPLFLDVSVWLPLVWDGHVASEATHRWLASQSEDLIVCRITELAMLRHLTNPAIMGNDVYSNVEAAGFVESFLAQPDVVFRSEPAEIGNYFPRLGRDADPSRNRWTDAYLAAFSIASKIEFITYDRGFSRYQSEGLTWRLLKTDSPG